MKPFWISIIGAALTAATLDSQAQVDGPGTALLLNGTNGFATVTNAGTFNFTGAFTVEAWINTTNLNLQWQAIVTKGDSAWRLHRYEGSDVISFGTSGLSYEDTYGATPIDDGEWHHIAGVYDGTKKYLYVDGALDGFNNVSGTLGTNSYALAIGENTEATNRIWDGEIDEVRIWNVALSQDQILTEMHQSLTGNEPGLVAYYRLDEGTGTNITNSASGGGAQNGLLTAGAAFVTSTAPIGAPAVTTGAAAGVTTNAATFNGTITFNYQPTSYYFRYGTTTNYGNTTPVSPDFSPDADPDNAPGLVTQSLGLFPGITYHYQIVGSNSAGVSFGGDVVFTTPSHTISTLYTLGNGSDGTYPNAGLILSGNALYGTARAGGASGSGVVFGINTNGTGYTNLYSFAGGTGGENPGTTLLQNDGILYGTTQHGGPSFAGSVFAVGTNGLGFSNIFGFAGADGDDPSAGLVGSGITLYGTTVNGGSSNVGTIFEVTTDGSGFAVLYQFTGGNDGAFPQSAFVLSGNRLYGTAAGGGEYGSGTVFAINVDGTGFATLHSFAPTSGSAQTNADGAHPQADLLLAGGTLYGVTANGGATGGGTLFAVSTNGAGFTNLHNFIGANDGTNPTAGLILAGQTLYGTAFGGGLYGGGTIFGINTNGTGFTNIFDFAVTNGSGPNGPLVLSDNTLYGTTFQGGSNGKGTVFSLSLGSATPIPLFIEPGGREVILTWGNPAFSLQSAPTPNGVFTNVPNATSPYTNAMTGRAQFFRLIAN